jgi:hypothetical protein
MGIPRGVFRAFTGASLGVSPGVSYEVIPCPRDVLRGVPRGVLGMTRGLSSGVFLSSTVD